MSRPGAVDFGDATVTSGNGFAPAVGTFTFHLANAEKLYGVHATGATVQVLKNYA